VQGDLGGDLDERGLRALSALLRVRHAIDDEIAALIGTTPTPGHVGEAVAAAVFDIELAASGVNPGFDGVFRSGPLAGRTVNVKAYAERTGLLDISPHPCDWYLVLMGPPRASSEKGRSLPFRVEQVFLFDIVALRASLVAAGVGVGIASSVRKAFWEAARLYPQAASGLPLTLDDRMRGLLGLFG
jgi:hypothetical protein